MMDINSRVDWKAGMEITDRTFIELNENLNIRQQVAARVANGNRMGILPDAEFSCQGVFVKNTLEIERFRCMALLPSGRIIHADERVVVPIPMLYGDEYYLTVGFGKGCTEFDKEGVPFIRPEYVYAVCSMADMEAEDVIPVMKFKVMEGIFSMDTDYIPPCLWLSSDLRFGTFIAHYVDRLEALTGHANLEDGEGKRALLRYVFLLKGFRQENSVSRLVQLTGEIAQAIDYYIMRPHTEHSVEIPACSSRDVRQWLHWLEEYTVGAATVLDRVVLEDHTIDFDELKAQIKAELYERMRPELHDLLLAEVKEELRKELKNSLQEELAAYIRGPLKEELQRVLQTSLSAALFQKLYTALYDALYKELYVPVEETEEETFMPLI